MAATGDPQPPVDVDSNLPSSPLPHAPGAFSSPNGVNGASSEDKPPRPPPHRSPTSSGPNDDAESFKAAGNKLFKAKQYDLAVEQYTKGKNPTSPVLSGIQYSTYVTAIEADPKASTYRSNRAAALMSANKFVQALPDAKAADDLEPDNPKIQHRLARIYTSLGRPSEAMGVYERIKPAASATDIAGAKNMQHHITQAENQIKEGTTGSMVLFALDQAERGLGSGVRQPRKWRLMRGEAYLKMGNENALGDAQNVAMGMLRENSQDPDALVLRGRVLYSQGENGKAIQHFRQALNCDPDYKDGLKFLRMVQKMDRMKEEGNSLFKTGKHQQAVDMYTQALEIDPANKGTNSKMLQNRALCYSRVSLRPFHSLIMYADPRLVKKP